MNSPEFDPRWLEERIASFPEGVFLDFKIEPPILEEKSDEHFTFAKHLIAFGNIARSTGRECHIVFGVDDETRKTKDLRNFYHPADIKKWNSEIPIHKKQTDGVLEKIRMISEKWIAPEVPKFSLQYGELNGVFLSYLTIYPTKTSVSFCTKKQHKNRSAGTVFVRVCSSSVPIEFSEVGNLLPFSEIEYLSRTEWQRFFQVHMAGEFLSAYDLLPAFKHKTNQGADALETIIQAINNDTQSILISGIAGAGKSTLLRRIAYRLSYSVNLADEVSRAELGEGEGKINEETFVVTNFSEQMSNLPRSRVPIYISLRTTFRDIKELDRLFLAEINKIVGKDFAVSTTFDSFRNNKNISWVLLLDGVDEIRNLDAAGPILGEWLQLLVNNKNVQVVLTARPYAANAGSVSKVFDLAPLQPDEILFLIKGKIELALLPQNDRTRDELTPFIEDVMRFLEAHPDILSFVNRHRAVDGLLEFLGFAAESISTRDTPRIFVDPHKDIQQQESMQVETSKNSLPVVGREDDFASDDYIEIDLPYENIVDLKNEQPVRMAELVNVVYKHLQTAEVIRQKEWGKEAENEADSAAYAIAKSAWNGNWQLNELNLEKTPTDESLLDWNLFAGFVTRLKKPRFQYCCDLFQQYLIAEYGCENKSDEMEAILKIHGGVMNDRIQKITQLYNEFCELRGQEPLILQ